MYELQDIRKLRKRIGITQAELSKKAGVSQSLIAKIESSRVEPTFRNVKRIFDVLTSLNKEEQTVAAEVMVKRIIDCKRDDPLTEVIEKMKKYKISQLPVFSGENVVGMVSESAILDKISNPKEVVSLLKVADVLEEVPPIVSVKTPTTLISVLLRQFALVLVSDKGKVVGVITKSDLLNMASRAG